MNKDLLRRILEEQRQSLLASSFVPRDVSFEAAGNYVVTGPRRAGKSTLLKLRALSLIKEGTPISSIAIVDFEDNRLRNFVEADFEDLLLVAREGAEGRVRYFLDEVQNVEGWERFARRMADQGERLDITGSNAAMLSKDIAARLGGRFLSLELWPYSFVEYLRAQGLSSSRITGKEEAAVEAALERYLYEGGYPEALLYKDKSVYLSSVYGKVVEGDIIVRNGLRNGYEMRLLVEKLTECLGRPVFVARLLGVIKAAGGTLTRPTLYDYLRFLEEGYLLFSTSNYLDAFGDRQSKRKHYFSDNGFLSLFLDREKKGLYLENLVAIYLRERFGKDLCYILDSKEKIDVDFYLPSAKTAIQVAYELSEDCRKRELSSFSRLSSRGSLARRFILVTRDGRGEEAVDGLHVEVVALADLLLGQVL